STVPDSYPTRRSSDLNHCLGKLFNSGVPTIRPVGPCLAADFESVLATHPAEGIGDLPRWVVVASQLGAWQARFQSRRRGMVLLRSEAHTSELQSRVHL